MMGAQFFGESDGSSAPGGTAGRCESRSRNRRWRRGLDAPASRGALLVRTGRRPFVLVRLILPVVSLPVVEDDLEHPLTAFQITGLEWDRRKLGVSGSRSSGRRLP